MKHLYTYAYTVKVNASKNEQSHMLQRVVKVGGGGGGGGVIDHVHGKYDRPFTTHENNRHSEIKGSFIFRFTKELFCKITFNYGNLDSRGKTTHFTFHEDKI